MSKPTDRKKRIRRVARPTSGRETTKTGSRTIRRASTTRTPIRTNIVKRDGSVQRFSRTKLTSSITKAGATHQQANLVTDRVTRRLAPKDTVTTKTLSSMTARSLSKVSTTAAKSYTAYRAQKISSIPSAVVGTATVSPSIQSVQTQTQSNVSGIHAEISESHFTPDQLQDYASGVQPDISSKKPVLVVEDALVSQHDVDNIDVVKSILLYKVMD